MGKNCQIHPYGFGLHNIILLYTTKIKDKVAQQDPLYSWDHEDHTPNIQGKVDFQTLEGYIHQQPLSLYKE